MPSVVDVLTAIKTRLTTGLPGIPFRFQDDQSDLPDDPVAFVYVELILDPPQFVAHGGGRGGNLQMTTGRIEAQILFPVGIKQDEGLTWGEQICALLRGQRLDDVSYLAGNPLPTSGRSEDGAYDHIGTAVIELWFEQVG